MAITIQLSTALRNYCHGQEDLEVNAGTVREALGILAQNHPQLYSSVCDEAGFVRRHVNVFVNDELVPKRDNGGLETALVAGDILSIFPSVSGG